MSEQGKAILRTREIVCSLSSSHQIIWISSVLALAAGGCGRGSSLASPTAPSATTSVVTTLSPTPLTIRNGGSAGAYTYQLSGDVTFRNVGESALRLVSLDVELTDAANISERQRVQLDLALPGGQFATRPLSDMIVVRTVRDPVRLTFTAQAIDGDGRQLELTPVNTPVIVVSPTAPTAVGPPVTFVGAGDIANCALSGASATARLLDTIPGDVFTLGDNVYPSGTADAFASCYDSTWGRHRFRTHPAPGNHDWEVNGGAPYLSYFGGAAGPGFYSFNVGAWHVLSLNSNISAQPGSLQYEWARADLAASGATCTLAYWHHPLFSSGPNGNNGQMRSMWRLLDEASVEMVMVGHDHLYERFAPQDADGVPTPSGMREFVVGTGGGQPSGAVAVQANSEVRLEQSWGVLKLTLRSDAYDWEFVPVAGQSARDFGTAPCTR